jgi:hypothetical protein
MGALDPSGRNSRPPDEPPAAPCGERPDTLPSPVSAPGSWPAQYEDAYLVEDLLGEALSQTCDETAFIAGVNAPVPMGDEEYPPLIGECANRTAKGIGTPT